jgi:hypothetical protein
MKNTTTRQLEEDGLMVKEFLNEGIKKKFFCSSSFVCAVVVKLTSITHSLVYHLSLISHHLTNHSHQLMTYTTAGDK